KYSPTGAKVSARLMADEAAIRLDVSDTGPGIPAELQRRIFDRFVRGDAARSHEYDTLTSGAGLGLSIARWIAEAHGGTLELTHSNASGTVFACACRSNHRVGATVRLRS